MANKNYIVRLTPSIKTESGFLSLVCSSSCETHQIEAGSFNEIAAKRDELVKGYAYSCNASVTLNRGQRKSPGFDNWADSQPDVFNRDNTHPELADEAHQAVA